MRKTRDNFHQSRFKLRNYIFYRHTWQERIFMLGLLILSLILVSVAIHVVIAHDKLKDYDEIDIIIVKAKPVMSSILRMYDVSQKAVDRYYKGVIPEEVIRKTKDLIIHRPHPPLVRPISIGQVKALNTYMASRRSMCNENQDKMKQNGRKNHRNMTVFCECVPGGLDGVREVGDGERELARLTNKTMAHHFTNGYWRPEGCMAYARLVIIIPYIEEVEALDVITYHLNQVIQAQLAQYLLLVVEQDNYKTGVAYNKGALMNAAFKYAMKKYNPDCVIFHQVDLIPEDGRNFYHCYNNQPFHMSSAQSDLHYTLPFKDYFRGVVAFKPETFTQLNGYSNQATGRYYVDDDMAFRIRNKKITIVRNNKRISRFKSLDYYGIDRVRDYRKRFFDLDSDNDGLNSMDYGVVEERIYPGYVGVRLNFKFNDKVMQDRHMNRGKDTDVKDGGSNPTLVTAQPNLSMTKDVNKDQREDEIRGRDDKSQVWGSNPTRTYLRTNKGPTNMGVDKAGWSQFGNNRDQKDPVKNNTFGGQQVSVTANTGGGDVSATAKGGGEQETVRATVGEDQK